MSRTFIAAVGALLLTAGLAEVACGDPRPGRDLLKFSQRPMFNTSIEVGDQIGVFDGHDELSTAWGVPVAGTNFVETYQGNFMADDFADRFDRPIVHVKWWGSYLNRPTSVPDPRVRRFLISIESDIPADPGGFSRPGVPLLSQVVDLDPSVGPDPFPIPGFFREREIWPTSVDGPIYEYNAELHLDKAFPQKPDTVYWLKIVALVDLPNPNIPLDGRLQWGWHNRDYTKMNPLASVAPAVTPGEHVQGVIPGISGGTPIWHFQDDSVDGIVNVRMNPNMPSMPEFIQQDVFGPKRYEAPWDGPSLIAQYSKDLAFELFTVPEPGTAAIAVLSLLGCGFTARRRTRRQ